jgi:hypothetical protein
MIQEESRCIKCESSQLHLNFGETNLMKSATNNSGCINLNTVYGNKTTEEALTIKQLGLKTYF